MQPQGVNALWLVLTAPLTKGWPGWVYLYGWLHTDVRHGIEPRHDYPSQ